MFKINGYIIILVLMLTGSLSSQTWGQEEDRRSFSHGSSSTFHSHSSEHAQASRPHFVHREHSTIHSTQVPRRIHAIQQSHPVTRTSFTYHHHYDSWHPRYNFYQHHYHFYPYVYVTPTLYLSSDYSPVVFSGENYYYDQGIFYQDLQDGQGYTAVVPPIGAIVKTIPAGAAQMVVNTDVYYIYNDVYYKQIPGGYQVVEPPS